MALLEHEDGHTEQPELARRRAKTVDALFHGVADVDQRLHPLHLVLLARVGKPLPDLGVAAAALDAAHQFGEPVAVPDPSGGATFVQSPEVDELDVEPANARRF